MMSQFTRRSPFGHGLVGPKELPNTSRDFVWFMLSESIFFQLEIRLTTGCTTLKLETRKALYKTGNCEQ